MILRNRSGIDLMEACKKIRCWISNLCRKIRRCHDLLLVAQWCRQNFILVTMLLLAEVVLIVFAGALITALAIYATGLVADFVHRMVWHQWWAMALTLLAAVLIWGLFRIVVQKAKERRRVYLMARRKCRGHVVRPSVEDELGRTPFAKSFIKRLRGMSTRQTVYVALYGKWGEGKTTVVDYISNIATMDAPEMIFVDFNPWRRLPNESFADQMFSAIAERLRIEKLGGSLPQKLTMFGARISYTRFRGLLSTLPEIGLSAAYIFDSFISLSSSKDRLNALLRQLRRNGHRIVVVIDDVDRMPPAEIVDLIRLIRANGDLEYLTYLVVADDVHLARALQQMLNVPGDDLDEGYAYLEKIFPYSEQLPPSPVEALPTSFMRRISVTAAKHHFECPRHDDKRMECVFSYLTTMRRVKMLDAEVDKYLEYLSEVACISPNVDFTDLVALTAMKLYEKDFYERLYVNRKKFYDWTKVISGARNEYDDVALKLMLAPTVPLMRWEWIKMFLAECAGIIKTYKSGDNTQMMYIYGVDQDVALSNFRLASAVCFENYFTGYTGTGLAVSRKELHEIEHACGDVNALMGIFRSKATENRLESFIHFLGGQRSFEWVSNEKAFLRSLVRLNAEIFDRSWGHDGFEWRESPYNVHENVWYCFCCICRYLNHGKLEDKSKIILSVLSDEEDIVLLSRIVASDDQYHLDDRDMDSAFFTKNDYLAAQEMFCRRVECRVRNRKMNEQPYGFSVRRTWMSSCAKLSGLWPDRMRDALQVEAAFYPEVVILIESFRTRGYRRDCEQDPLPVDYDELKRHCHVEQLISTLEKNEANLIDKDLFYLSLLRNGVDHDKKGIRFSVEEQLALWNAMKK